MSSMAGAQEPDYAAEGEKLSRSSGCRAPACRSYAPANRSGSTPRRARSCTSATRASRATRARSRSRASRARVLPGGRREVSLREGPELRVPQVPDRAAAPRARAAAPSDAAVLAHPRRLRLRPEQPGAGRAVLTCLAGAHARARRASRRSCTCVTSTRAPPCGSRRPRGPRQPDRLVPGAARPGVDRRAPTPRPTRRVAAARARDDGARRGRRRAARAAARGVTARGFSRRRLESPPDGRRPLPRNRAPRLVVYSRRGPLLAEHTTARRSPAILLAGRVEGRRRWRGGAVGAAGAGAPAGTTRRTSNGGCAAAASRRSPCARR